MTVAHTDEHRFAFVEYESRRDADDAYHEMHNKRIGRDDLLKIEVTISPTCPYHIPYSADSIIVGSYATFSILAL